MVWCDSGERDINVFILAHGRLSWHVSMVHAPHNSNVLASLCGRQESVCVGMCRTEVRGDLAESFNLELQQ